MNAPELKRFPLLADLTQAELEMLVPLIDQKSYGAGDRVTQVGAASEGVLLLAAGSVKVAAASGDESRLRAPAVIGAAALVTVGSRGVDTVAEGDCQVWVLSRTAFHRFAEDAPRAAVRVLEAVVADLAGLLRSGAELP